MRRLRFAILLLLAMRAASAEEPYRVLVPSGDAPHPAVLLVPGCSGLAAVNGINLYEERANELQTAGYLVVFVDYLGRFGDCAHTSHAQAAEKLLDAAAWVRAQPGTDPHSLSVIGWSYGGGAVLAALSSRPSAFAKAVLYYPDCRAEPPWSGASASVLMLLGGKDDVALPELCDPVMQGAPANSVRVIVYRNAHHGFDARSRPEPVRYPFGTVGYDAEAAAASWAATLEFLRQSG
jgi:dienelactone hydrolase